MLDDINAILHVHSVEDDKFFVVSSYITYVINAIYDPLPVEP